MNPFRGLLELMLPPAPEASPKEPESELLNYVREKRGSEPLLIETVPKGSVAVYGIDTLGVREAPLSMAKFRREFGEVPFSVLDARSAEWQTRKAAWIDLGIRSELGRGAGVWVESETGGPDDRQANYKKKLAPGGSPRPACDYSNGERGDGAGRPIRSDGNKLGFSAAATIKRHGLGFDGSKVLRGEQEAEEPSGTSIFDPVICEMAYRWFAPPGGLVLDPFAGGSVRGVVASKMGLRYLGVDLSERQLDANRDQARAICIGKRDILPEWRAGDSRHIELSEEGDLLFSCPPYGDLEVYSEAPGDLSNMSHGEFCEAYRAIIGRFLSRLRDDRFAIFVVGDFRAKDGLLRNFVSETIAAFHAGGARLYNECILVTAVGSLPIRARKGFEVTRKMGKTHQNVLVFIKGDPRRATAACSPQMGFQLCEEEPRS
jgi:hypothetical protein